jgi:hypothetical protein
MMCGGGGGSGSGGGSGRGGSKIGGIGPGDKFSSMIGLCASIDYGGRCCPTAAMRPYSRHRSTQQSANMLGNRFVSSKLGKIIINYVY